MKIIINVFIMLVATIATVNAQFFVEGGFGVGYRGGNESDGGVSKDSYSTLTITVAPKVGYWLSDGISVGASPFFIWDNQKIPATQTKEKSELKTQRWGFSVFGRYRLLGTEKFSVLVESSMDIGGGTVKEKIGSDTSLSRSMSSIRFNVFPALSYDLTDKFSIIARCETFNLGFTSETIKDKITDRKVTTNYFNFRGSSSIYGRIDGISIGFIYNF